MSLNSCVTLDMSLKFSEPGLHLSYWPLSLIVQEVNKNGGRKWIASLGISGRKDSWNDVLFDDSAVPVQVPGRSELSWAVSTKHTLGSKDSCCLVAQLCPTPCNPVDCSTPGFPVLHHLPEFAQTPVHWVGDAIQPSLPLSSHSPAFNLSQHQGFFKWVNSLHQVAKVLEFQLQHQSFQWIFRTDFL